MPELPEVRTVANTLKNMILNTKITKVEVYHNNIIDKTDLDFFKSELVNQTINDIKTKGKMIMFILDDYVLFSHLRMEGKYYVDDTYTKDKHSHVIFSLDNNKFLRYHDTRKFGKMSLYSKKYYLEHPYLKNIGDEPFQKDYQELYLQLKDKKTMIKPTLLDQKFMSGLGNIYVDEVLFKTRIHPETLCNQLTRKDYLKIVEASIEVLNKAISLGGTTIRSYTSSLGVSGKFQNELQVHTKVNQACPICNNKIVKTQVKGRGTYICLHCQKKR